MTKRVVIVTSKKLLDKSFKDNRKQFDINNLEPLDRDAMSEDFIRFIGDLNAKYHDSLFWLATSVSSKNQFASPLYKNIYVLLQITNLIEKTDQDEIAILIENEWIVKQISAYCKSRCIEIKVIEPKLRNIRASLYNHKKAIISIGSFFINNWIKKYFVSIKLNRQIKEKLDCKKSYYILRTWIDKRSFDKNKLYGSDPYFGVLPSYLKKNKNLIIRGNVVITDNNLK